METGNQAKAAIKAATEKYRTGVREQVSPIATQAGKHSAAVATTLPTGSPPTKDASRKLPPESSAANDPMERTTSMGTLRSNNAAIARGIDCIGWFIVGAV